jgi:hypothetical protein
MVSIARRQLEAGRDLTRGEIEAEICREIKRPVPKLADQLAKIDAALTALISDGDSSLEIIKARALIRARIMVLRNSPVSSVANTGDVIDLAPIVKPVEATA